MVDSVADFNELSKDSDHNEVNETNKIHQSYDHELVNVLRSLMSEEFDNNRDSYDQYDIQRTMDTSKNWHVWRYLSWYYFNISDAFEGMKKMLKWRKSFDVSQLRVSDSPSEFWLFGPFIVCGQTDDGVSNFYIIARLFFPSDKTRLLIQRFVIAILEEFDQTRPPSDKFNVIFEHYGATLSNVDTPSIKWFLTVKDAYNVRLNGLFLLGVPLILRPIVSIFLSWLPEQLSRNTRCGTFDELLRPMMTDDNIPDIYGGSCARESYRLAPVDTRPMSEFEPNESLDKCIKLMTGWLTDHEMIDLRKRQEIHVIKSKSSN